MLHSAFVLIQKFLDTKAKRRKQAKYVTSLSELTKNVNHVHWQFGERSLDT